MPDNLVVFPLNKEAEAVQQFATLFVALAANQQRTVLQALYMLAAYRVWSREPPAASDYFGEREMEELADMYTRILAGDYLTAGERLARILGSA